MGKNDQYDIVIVGAGPAGLSAARTTARLGFSTLVVERAMDAGRPAHPCNAILAPMPGFIKGRRLLGDLFYSQLDLLVPLSLVVGYPRLHRFISPGGYQVEAPFASGDGTPVAAVDKGGLLRMMAEQAEAAGADFRFGTEALGLLSERGRVSGIRTAAGDIHAGVVLAAEGVSRRLSREAGLFPASKGGWHALVLNRELEAPAVRRSDLGQITTFGKRFTSAREGFGAVVMPMPGRANVTYTLLADSPHHHTEHSAQYYMDEYMQGDPRISQLLAGATTIQQAAYTIAINTGPRRVARRGFLSLGDAATPAGHVGILPAIWLGRKAALIAAEGLDAGDVSAACLGMYGELFHDRVLRTLKSERQLMLSLAQMSDFDLDRLSQVMARLPLAAPFFSGWQGIPWEATRWMNAHYPAGTYATSLVQRILDRDTEHRGEPAQLVVPGLWPAPFNANVIMS